MSFTVLAQVFRYTKYKWQKHFEVFAICKNCLKPSVFLLSEKNIDRNSPFDKENGLVQFSDSLNNAFNIEGFISLKDYISVKIPEHLPPAIARPFREGASCFAIGCSNAAATMFRLCVDLVTRSLLPNEGDASVTQPNAKQRRDLGLRLQWLFDQELLPNSLRDLAKCIHQDGNDGAHAGNLTQEDAEDMQDFTRILLERLVTEPKNLELAEARRAERRSGAKKSS